MKRIKFQKEKTKINFSLSLKLTLTVVLLSAIVIFLLTYYNISQQDRFLDDSFIEKGKSLAKSLDASIEFHDVLNDTQELQGYIEKFNDSNPVILKISISIADEEGELTVIASSDIDFVGSSPSSSNYYCYNITIKEKEDAVLKLKYHVGHGEESHTIMMVITPVNLSGRIAGTYEMFLSMDEAYASFDAQMRLLVIISVLFLFSLIFGSLYLLRRAIVKPIIVFRDTTKLIGGGDLDAKVKVESRDELGELAVAFNKMTHDLKISRAKIQGYSKTLEKLLDQKDEFIGQLGHDLKNPLTPLVGLLPMIMEQEKDPKIKEHLRIISSNVEYMKDLIFKTLQLAKLRSPDTKFDFETLNLMQETNTVVENQQLLLKENNMTVENKVKDNIFVQADKLRLTELFNNLITNAVKYKGEGKGSITLDAKKEKDVVTVSVKDTGIGMTEKQIERIFDEFYMADKSRDGLDSSGLGLSICKRIVEKHGGRIWVESPGSGKGSTFYFTLKTVDEKIIKDK